MCSLKTAVEKLQVRSRALFESTLSAACSNQPRWTSFRCCAHARAAACICKAHAADFDVLKRTPQAAQGAHAVNERRKTTEQLTLQVRAHMF